MSIPTRSVLVALTLAGLTACSGDQPSGPGPQQQAGFDSRRVKEGLAAVDQVGSSEILQSFRVLGVQLGGASQVAVPGSDRFVAAVRQVAGIVRPDLGPLMIPIIRSSMLGRTFTWNPETRQYAVDPSRTGAPGNGVRFILYQLDAEERPTTTEIGYADLTDERASSPTSAGLRLKVVSQGKTWLDYAVDLSGSIGTATVHVHGFMSDGTERVDFDLTTTGQLFGRGGTVTIEASLDVVGKQFGVDAKVTAEAGQESGDGTVELTVTAGSDVVRIAATTAGGTVDATVRVNGALFATIKGPAANPVIRGEGGRELTTEELTALGEAFAFADGVFKLFGGLLAPAGALLLLGLGL